MPNTYFQFKQFRIEQDRCALKVTTEGCLLGALVTLDGKEKYVLDIGTGTGLLSLMIAQRSGAIVYAVELAPEAVEQANENFKISPWNDRMTVIHEGIQAFAQRKERKYDLIVSNPPFFKGHLKSGKAKDRAIHNDELPFKDLALAVANLLGAQGRFWVIYPEFQFEQFVASANLEGLSLQVQYLIHDRPERPIFRKIGVFGFKEIAVPETEILCIKESNGTYSDRFRGLVEAYYL